MIYHFRPQTTRTDHNPPIWTLNHRNGPLSTNLDQEPPKRTVVLAAKRWPHFTSQIRISKLFAGSKLKQFSHFKSRIFGKSFAAKSIFFSTKLDFHQQLASIASRITVLIEFAIGYSCRNQLDQSRNRNY